MSECRRCAECKDSPHHWMHNPDFGNDEPEAENPDADFICKHCEALGDECESCNGLGENFTATGPCETCDGDGVIERKTT
jgi:DnaJ-class molecular chaperone